MTGIDEQELAMDLTYSKEESMQYFIAPEILAFIIGEVRRQRFDPETVHGAKRVLAMIEAWYYALVCFKVRPFPELSDILLIGKQIEPEKNAYGFRKVAATINGDPLLPAAHIPRALEKLWESKELYTPDEFYIEFEKIHPFVDGNGRVGKILHNWIMGTLQRPQLIRDYFNRGVP